MNQQRWSLTRGDRLSAGDRQGGHTYVNKTIFDCGDINPNVLTGSREGEWFRGGCIRKSYRGRDQTL